MAEIDETSADSNNGGSVVKDGAGVDVEAEWRLACAELGTCHDCRSRGLLHGAAKPLFGRFTPRRGGVLFVFEAPNLGDTEDQKKGYLTYDSATDPTGRFAHILFTEVLGFSAEDFQVTNAVLCLPAARETGKNRTYPVRSAQMRTCSKNICRQIRILDPLVVASVGAKALDALRFVAGHGLPNLSLCVAKPRPWFDRWLFPLFHTSDRGRANRSAERQRDDWTRLRDFLRSKGALTDC
jgi:uracil-DNA glycosylase family 4